MDTSTPISTCAISIYIHTTAICPELNVEHATISIWDGPKHPYSIGWHLQYKTDWAPLNPVTRHKPSKIAGLLGRKGRLIWQGAYTYNNWENDKKDIIKIGTADVVIQKIMKGRWFLVNRPTQPKKRIWLPSKQPIQNTPCLDGARQDWHDPKSKNYSA